MDKSDYTNKAKILINGTNTYQPLDTDPSKTTVNRINKKLKSLKDKDKLNKRTYMIKQAVSGNLASINTVRLVRQAQCFTRQITNLANLRISPETSARLPCVNTARSTWRPTSSAKCEQQT